MLIRQHCLIICTTLSLHDYLTYSARDLLFSSSQYTLSVINLCTILSKSHIVTSSHKKADKEAVKLCNFFNNNKYSLFASLAAKAAEEYNTNTFIWLITNSLMYITKTIYELKHNNI